MKIIIDITCLTCLSEDVSLEEDIFSKEIILKCNNCKVLDKLDGQII